MRARLVACSALIVAAALAGCGGSGGSHGAPPPAESEPVAQAVTVAETETAAEPVPEPVPETETVAETETEAQPRPIAVAPGAERDVEGLACLGRRDAACVLRLFGEGRAETPRQLAMVIQAQRMAAEHASGGPNSADACSTMASLLQRFPDSPEAMRYRTFHQANCPH
jgi:hypothetical protein